MSSASTVLRPGLLLYVSYREDGTRCAVSVPATSTVARVKASFLRARRGQGHHLSIIDMYFRGQWLEDRMPLLSYGVKRGDEIEAVTPDIAGMPSTTATQTERAITFYVDIDEAAAELARARAGGVPPPSPSRSDMHFEATPLAFNDGFVLDPQDESAQSSQNRFQITRSPGSPKSKAREWAEQYQRTTHAFQQRQQECIRQS